MGMNILVTGGAGFIGSNFVRHMLETYSDVELTNLDVLSYAGNLENLAGLEHEPRYRFVKGGVASEEAVENVLGRGPLRCSCEFCGGDACGSQLAGCATVPAGESHWCPDAPGCLPESRGQTVSSGFDR